MSATESSSASDQGQDYAATPDHGSEHKQAPPASVSGGASSAGGPADADDPKGESIPGYDPQNQPDFAYRKPGNSDGAGLVDKVMGSLAKGGNSSG